MLPGLDGVSVTNAEFAAGNAVTRLVFIRMTPFGVGYCLIHGFVVLHSRKKVVQGCLHSWIG
eukprot:scaffold296914_cov33-Tisochrysis_lutea.AAC.6